MRISAEDLCSLTPTTQLNRRVRVDPRIVCFALAGVSERASDFLRFKYAHDYSKVLHVAHDLMRRSRKRAADFIWDDLLFDMCMVAIEESFSDAMCGTCNGKAWISTGEKMIVCFKCRGSGRRSRGSKEIADRLDVSLSFYKENCRYLLERYMASVLAGYETELYQALRDRVY